MSGIQLEMELGGVEDPVQHELGENGQAGPEGGFGDGVLGKKKIGEELLPQHGGGE